MHFSSRPAAQRSFYLAIGIWAACFAALLGAVAQGDVIVLSNRAGTQIPFRFAPASGEVVQLTLPADDTVPLFLDGKADITYAARGKARQYSLDANCAYFFGRGTAGEIQLQKIGLGDDSMAAGGRKLPGSASRTPPLMIPVKILVDEEERARPAYWERRLRTRVEAASAIFEKQFHIGFHVDAVGTWNSDNSLTNFFDSLGDFERKVDPAPARIAIGFTSQWPMAQGRIHMAGTRGPLHSHILVREGSPEINEAERLEFLVHELGHYLGAAHSPEPNSVMRPVLGDRRAGTTGFRIQFDPVNALTIGMLSEEMRRSNATSLAGLQTVTRQRLEKIYLELARALPDDPAGMQYAMLMRTAASPLAASAKKVLQQIVGAAIANRALPGVPINGEKKPARRDGDDLTEFYVREAARAAAELPEEVGPAAFLLGVAIGLDQSNALSGISGGEKLVSSLELTSERMTRMTVLGKPTMRGRVDLMQHFFASAFLTAAVGADRAQSAVQELELQTAQLPGGFSFKCVAADRAGNRFGRMLLEKRLSLGSLANTFAIASFMPEVDSFPEAISAPVFAVQYGTKTDARFTKQIREIDLRILVLPGFRKATSVFGH